MKANREPSLGLTHDEALSTFADCGIGALICARDGSLRAANQVAAARLAADGELRSVIARKVASGHAGGRDAATSVVSATDRSGGAHQPDASAILVRPLADGAHFLVVLRETAQPARTPPPLEPSAQHFIQLAEASPTPIWMASAAQSRDYFNAAWREFTGRDAAELGGDGWLDDIHPEDRPRLISRCAQAGSTARTFAVEYRLRRHDGRYRRFHEIATPRLAEDGRLLGYVGLCLDIDDRYHHEREIAKLSRALDQASLAVIITDAAGAIEYANPACCARFGYRADELIGRNPRLFKSGKVTPETYLDLWKTLQRGETWSGTLCNRRRDGTEVWESVSISPVRDEDGATTHYVSLKEDITDRLEASRRERELSRRMYRIERAQALGTLVGGIAHDFNNILMAILGFSELGTLQLQTGGSTDRVAAYLEEILIAGRRAKTLVKQLLAIGRAGPVELVDFAPATLADGLDTFVSVSLAEHEVVTHVDDELPWVHGDYNQLRQVLFNLLLNARDASPAGSRIEIRIERARLAAKLDCATCQETLAGDWLRLSVSDAGRGIGPSVRERLFEPFFTTKDVGDGAGLGLPVVDGIVHRHDGHLVVRSEPGAGSVFEAYLPLVSEPGGGA